MANNSGTNSGFDRDGFLLGGTALDWKRELENIFKGVENKTDKILELLDKIRELLKKDAQNGGGGGRQSGTGRRNSQGQLPPVDNAPPASNNGQPPIDVTVTVNDGNRPPRRANSGNGVIRQRDENGRFTGANNQGQGGGSPPPTVNPLPPAPPQNGGGGGGNQPPVPPSPAPQNRRRDSNGRFTGDGSGGENNSGGSNDRQRDANGRFTGEQKTFFERITDRIGGFFGTVKEAMFSNTDNLDPLISAAQETADITKAIFKPFTLVFKGGKALFNLFRPKRNAEAVAWFKRLFQQLRGIRQDNANRNGQGQGQGGGAGGGNGQGVGGLLLLRMAIPFLLPLMLLVAAGLGLAFGGAKLFDWMQEKFGGWIDGLKNSDIGKFITESWRSLVDGVSKKFGVAVEFFKSVKDTVKGTYDKVVQNTTDKMQKTADFFGGVKDKAVNGFNYVKEGVANTYDNIKTKNRQFGFNYVDNAVAFQAGKQITGLTDAQTRAYAADVAKTESGGIVNKRNSYGFLGQYQFGADALADEGVIDKSKLLAAKKMAGKGWYKKGMHKAFLEDSSNWNLEGGQDAFLNNKALQDRVFVSYTNKNIKRGMVSKAISKDSSAAQVAGYAKAAHLVGGGAANDLFINGVNKTDAYGTDARKYAQQGMAAITNLAPKVELKMAGQKQPTSFNENMPMPLKANVGLPVQSPLIPKMPIISNHSSISTATPLIYREATMPKPVMPKTQPLPVVDEKIALNTQQPIQVIAKVDKGQVGQDLNNRSLAHVVTGGISK